MFLGGPEGEGRGALRQEAVKSQGGGPSGSTSSPSQSLPAASEDITDNGVVCMRKSAFLALDELQWELRVSEKSGFRLAPAGARSGS